MMRIERHEYAARLQHGKQRDEQFTRTLDAYADAHFSADARSAQTRREPRRAGIQFAACETCVVMCIECEGGRIRLKARECLDTKMQRGRKTRHRHEFLRVPAASGKAAARTWAAENAASFGMTIRAKKFLPLFMR